MTKAPTREEVKLEFKAMPSVAKVEGERTVSGFCSVFGNIDAGGDRVVAGAFKKSITEGMRRVKHLWSHNPYEVPTAVIKGLYEAGRDELPDEILEIFPDAQGGLVVTREYLDTPKGNEILAAIKAGAITEMSFGFDVVKYEIEELTDTVTGRKDYIRNLKELRLWDTSDVTWGMNPATVAAKAGVHPYLVNLAALSRDLVEHPDALKAGRVLSASNLERLKNALAVLDEILLAAEPPADEEESAKALTGMEVASLMAQIGIMEHEIYLLR